MNSSDISIETISNRSDSIESTDSIKKHLKEAWSNKNNKIKVRRKRENGQSKSNSPKISDVLKYLTFININKINE